MKKILFLFLICKLSFCYTSHAFSPGANDIEVSNPEVQIIGSYSRVIFDVTFDSSQSRYLAFWLMGGINNNSSFSTYDLYIDGSSTGQQVAATQADWHLAYTTDNQPFHFEAGSHQIVLQGTLNDIPNVEVMFLKRLPSFSFSNNPLLFYNLQKSHIVLDTPFQVSQGTYRKINYNSIDNDSICPPNSYDAEINKAIYYTFYRLEYFIQGSLVTIQTDTIGNVDHTVYLFNKDNPALYSWASSSEGSAHASVSVIIPQSGFYYVLTKAADDEWGTCNVHINERSYLDVPIFDSTITVGHAQTGQTYANFAKSKNSKDPIMWLISGTVRNWNDDYVSDLTTSDIDWGNAARINSTLSNGDKVFVSVANSYTKTDIPAHFDIYVGCRMVKQEHPFNTYDFNNYKTDDVLCSANTSSYYNCIAWSVGEWTVFHDIGACLIGNIEPEVFYSQYGFTSEGATESNSCIDLWGYAKASSGQIVLTHASIKALANSYSAGYDWESKIGKYHRVFHPRNSIYGNPYHVFLRFKRQYSFNDSNYYQNPLKFRVLATTSFTELENKLIYEGIAFVPEQIMSSFKSLFLKCEKKGELLTAATINNYDLLGEYKDMLSFCKSHRSLDYVIFKKVGEDNPLAIKLLKDIVVRENMGLAKSVIEKAEEKQKADDGRIVIRPLCTEAKLFVKALLNEMSYDSISSEISYSDDDMFDISVQGNRIVVSFFNDDFSIISLAYTSLLDGHVIFVTKEQEMNRGKQSLVYDVPKSGFYVVTLVKNGEVFEKKIQIK